MKLGVKDINGESIDEIANKVRKLGFKAVALPCSRLERLGLNLNDEEEKVFRVVKMKGQLLYCKGEEK